MHSQLCVHMVEPHLDSWPMVTPWFYELSLFEGWIPHLSMLHTSCAIISAIETVL